MNNLFKILCFTIPLFSGVNINLDIIAQIESSNNTKAYNKRTKASGLYQITPICLKDYNSINKCKFKLKDMFNKSKAYIVAEWYVNERIPQLLKYYKLKDTLDNRLICYNAGIGRLIKNKIPRETLNYINKYKELL